MHPCFQATVPCGLGGMREAKTFAGDAMEESHNSQWWPTFSPEGAPAVGKTMHLITPKQQSGNWANCVSAMPMEGRRHNEKDVQPWMRGQAWLPAQTLMNGVRLCIGNHYEQLATLSQHPCPRTSDSVLPIQVWELSPQHVRTVCNQEKHHAKLEVCGVAKFLTTKLAQAKPHD